MERDLADIQGNRILDNQLAGYGVIIIRLPLNDSRWQN